jgi:hypothetical protein
VPRPEGRGSLLEEWAQAFFDSLAPADQQSVQKRLGAKPSKYIQKRVKDFPLRKRVRNGVIGYELQDTPKPEFLRKPPLWKMLPYKAWNSSVISLITFQAFCFPRLANRGFSYVNTARSCSDQSRTP